MTDLPRSKVRKYPIQMIYKFKFSKWQVKGSSDPKRSLKIFKLNVKTYKSQKKLKELGRQSGLTCSVCFQICRMTVILQETMHDLEKVLGVKGHVPHQWMIFNVNFYFTRNCT